MRNKKIPLHIKQSAYNDYKKGTKVVDIITKYKICWGTLYTYIHKQEQIKNTFKNQMGGQIDSVSNDNNETIDTVSVDNALLELEKL